MKYGPFIFLAAFFALSASWSGFVLAPQLQIGRALPETNVVDRTQLYPQGRPGLARQGLEVYRANGCAACHSQQIGQTGTACDVVLSDIGTNPVAVVEGLRAANVGLTNINPPGLSAGLPKTILRGVSIDLANTAAGAVKSGGGKARVEIVPLGPDIDRGWGLRRTVAADFLFDSPALPGSLRIGPDLANAGLRLPDPNWHLRHLYAPRSLVANSPMPPYKFLFEERKLQSGQAPPLDGIALNRAGGFFDAAKDKEPVDRVIVPKPEAKALVAYLQSLRADVPLFEAPMNVSIPAPTNSPAATNAPPAR